MKTRISFLLLFSWFFINTSFAADSLNFLEMASLNPATRYQHFETDHFEFDFEEGYLNFTLEAAKHLEHAHRILSPILKWNPRSKIHVLVADNEDSANGFAMPSLRVGMVLIATPPDQWYSTAYTDNWIKLLAFHEYVHILNMDPTTDFMEILRIVYGDVIRPNGLWPRWMLEGLAVYFETRTSRLGRGRSPYYEGIVRSFFDEGLMGSEEKDRFNYGKLSGSWPYFPGGETPYLFGYHLWNQFAQQAHNDYTAGDYSLNSSGRVPFFIDGNLQKFLKKDWSDLWKDFVANEAPRYRKEISAVRSNGETPHHKISSSQYSAQGGASSPDGEWMAWTETRLDERQGLILKNLKTGTEKKIRDKVQGATLSFTPDSRFLVFSSLEQHRTFQLFSDLFAYDLKTARFHSLTQGMRAKDPDVSPDGSKITFTMVDHGTPILKIADLKLDYDHPGIENIRTLHRPDEFSILATPRWINNIEIAFSLQKLNESESRILKIKSDSTHAPEALIQNGRINRFPILCGHKILHVSDLNGIDNVYEGNQAITNVVTGVQFPFCTKDGKLHGSLLTANGFEITEFDTSPKPVITNSKFIATSSAPPAIEESLQSPEIAFNPQSVTDYAPFKTLAPRQWAPLGYASYNQNTEFSIGGTVLGFDFSGKHQYLGTFSYYSKTGALDGGLNYTYYGFRPAITLSASSYTSDLILGTNTSVYKRSHELALQFDHLTKWTWSSLRVSPYLMVDWNSVISTETGNRVSSKDPEYSKPLIPVAGAMLGFSDVYLSRLGFMPEGGSTITTATESRIYPDDFTLWKFMAEYKRFLSPGNHHVFQPTLRYFASSRPYGYERSFAMLKGKDTESLFDRGRGFNLNQMQLRGYSNTSFAAKSAFQFGLDYHFPLLAVFGGDGPLFLQQFHGFIFGEATRIPLQSGSHVDLPSFGLGATADTTLLWNLPISISAEWQNGTNKEYGGDGLFFISLSTSAL
jgi:hypothetical protein